MAKFQRIYLKDGTFLMAYNNDNIHKNHWHLAPDGTILAVKEDDQHRYKRKDIRKHINQVTGMNLVPEWDSSQDRRRQEWQERQSERERKRREREAQQKQYELSCAANYQMLRGYVQNACSQAQHGNDFRAAFDALKNAQNALRNTRPTKPEDRDALFNALQQGFAVLKRHKEAHRQQKQREYEARQAERARKQREYEERQRERERKQREWQSRQRDKISRLDGAIRRMEISIARDGDHFDDLRRKNAAVRPGRSADRIYRDLNRKMDQVGDRKADKQAKLRDMERELSRLKDQMYR